MKSYFDPKTIVEENVENNVSKNEDTEDEDEDGDEDDERSKSDESEDNSDLHLSEDNQDDFEEVIERKSINETLSDCDEKENLIDQSVNKFMFVV